jgi:hypothetical protein
MLSNTLGWAGNLVNGQSFTRFWSDKPRMATAIAVAKNHHQPSETDPWELVLDAGPLVNSIAMSIMLGIMTGMTELFPISVVWCLG